MIHGRFVRVTDWFNGISVNTVVVTGWIWTLLSPPSNDPVPSRYCAAANINISLRARCIASWNQCGSSREAFEWPPLRFGYLFGAFSLREQSTQQLSGSGALLSPPAATVSFYRPLRLFEPSVTHISAVCPRFHTDITHGIPH